MSASASVPLILRRGVLVDGSSPEPSGEVDILIEGERIREVSATRISFEGAQEIDLHGRTVLPGLIDCHMHANVVADDLHRLVDYPASFTAVRASNVLRDMLMRGFTTVRDAGGADWGLKQAIEEGHAVGPRMFIAGHALSQTGGHGDFRNRTDHSDAPCSCASALRTLARVVDGVDDIRKAVREEFRQGADQIKVMASGGVSGVNEHLHARQFSVGELRAAVEEADAQGSYVMAHAYTAAAIEHALEAGIRTIEHGNLIDERVARLVVAKGAYVVPTLVTYWLPEDGSGPQMTDAMCKILKDMLEAGLRSIGICRSAGVNLGFGTDLFGELHREQGREFVLRNEVQPVHEIIRSATAINAQILQQEGHLGTISEGALADVIAVEGDPLSNAAILGNADATALVIKGGKIYKNSIK